MAADTTYPHTRYYLGFNRVAGVGAVRLSQLIERCGSVEAAWHASHDDMAAAGFDRRARAALLDARSRLDLDAEVERVIACNIRLLSIEDPDYPRLLAMVPNPPPLLYMRGSLEDEDDWALAVVGTRSPTSYGKEATRKLVGEVAAAGLTIVSGLAVGIDSVAHTTALEAGGRTLAVLGCGVDVLYPERNKTLVEQILAGRGALLSEYAPGTRPLAANFPPRNRIISGLAPATLIVEAAESSGALITKDFALNQGREVFAVPGSIFSQKSKGPNLLIRDGATPATSGNDILEALNFTSLSVQREARADLETTLPENDTERTILAQLSEEPEHIDTICRACGLDIGQVSSTLMLMELKGMVRHVENMAYVRV